MHRDLSLTTAEYSSGIRDVCGWTVTSIIRRGKENLTPHNTVVVSLLLAALHATCEKPDEHRCASKHKSCCRLTPYAKRNSSMVRSTMVPIAINDLSSLRLFCHTTRNLRPVSMCSTMVPSEQTF
jgi:hypothetical protein